MEQGKGRDLRVSVVAQRLRLTPRQVRNLVYEGKLQGVYYSEKRLMVPEASLDAYLAAMNP